MNAVFVFHVWISRMLRPHTALIWTYDRTSLGLTHTSLDVGPFWFLLVYACSGRSGYMRTEFSCRCGVFLLAYLHSKFMNVCNNSHSLIHAATQKAAWQRTRGSLSDIFFCPFLSLHFSPVSVGGLNSPPTSISNSLCSLHASRESDFKPQKQSRPLTVFHNLVERNPKSFDCCGL